MGIDREYQNGFSPLADVVSAYTESVLKPDASRLSAEELHDLASLITVARHDRHGQKDRTTEIVALIDSDGAEVYREEISRTSTEGEI